MIAGGVNFDLYSGDCFHRVVVPFQFRDRFRFLREFFL